MRRVAAVLAITIAGCAGEAAAPNPPNLVPKLAEPHTSAAHLYVANATNVTVYDVTSRPIGKYVRTIQKGVVSPSVLAFDATGSLYVLNATSNGPVVTVYARGSKAVSRSITLPKKYPLYGMDVAPNGTMYVLQGGPSQKGYTLGGTILEYAPGASSVSKRLSLDYLYPAGMAIDSAGNVYAAGNGEGGLIRSNSTVVEFAATGSAPTYISDPQWYDGTILNGIVVDNAGNVYVSSTTPYSGIDVFPAGNTSPSMQIEVNGCPYAGGADAKTDLYVFDPCDRDLLVFAPGSTTPSLTIARASTILTTDAANNVYVGTSKGVFVYPPGSATTRDLITANINHPRTLAIGP